MKKNQKKSIFFHCLNKIATLFKRMAIIFYQFIEI